MALLATGWFLVTPIVLKHGYGLKPEIWLTVYFLGAVWWILDAIETGLGRSFVVAGVFAALALSTKLNVLAVGPVLLFEDGTVQHQGMAFERLAEFAGQGLVVNLWATWCVPCVAEMPALQAMARALAGDRIRVLALSSDRGGAAVVRKFYTENRIDGLDLWLDPKGEAARAWMAREYSWGRSAEILGNFYRGLARPA